MTTIARAGKPRTAESEWNMTSENFSVRPGARSGMRLAGRRVLVTGAGGFIGSHLAEALVREGAEVTAFVRYNSRGAIGFLSDVPEDVRRSLRVHAGDITDRQSISAAVAGQDVVFHLAALIAIPYSYLAPRSYMHVNAEGTLNVLEAVREHGTARLIHTSTSEVYGSAQYVPIDEAHPLQGQSPYSATKIGADKIVEAYHRSFAIPAVTIRPFNTFGPRQSARAVIPATIAQALWSDEVRLGATEPVRDMTYVSDTVEGYLTAAVTPGLEGGVYNLGTGKGHSIGDIAQRIMHLTGRNDTPVQDPERLRPTASEVDRLISDHQAFTAASGWTPAISLDDGLERTIAWFREQGPPSAPGEYAV